MRAFILFIAICSCVFTQAQPNYEIHIGPSISNVKHMIKGEQVVFPFKENAPLWNIGFQVGANRIFDFDSRFKLSVGARLQLRGDLDGEYEVYPERGDLNDIRFLYILTPINVMYKLLPHRSIFMVAGVSPDYLLDMNASSPGLVYFPQISSFIERFGLTGQIGYKFYLSDKWSCELLYSQSILNITTIEYEGPSDEFDITSTYKNQAFELNIYYKL